MIFSILLMDLEKPNILKFKVKSNPSLSRALPSSAPACYCFSTIKFGQNWVSNNSYSVVVDVVGNPSNLLLKVGQNLVSNIYVCQFWKPKGMVFIFY